ncbi:glycoside hydrolase family 57 protein [Candidatus Dojkabacteria bacterium]|nr:glycoside hydrolase family 57 protein [Candidatus Dojkabacteria bacterium]
MGKSICFYFQVHQPWRLSKISLLEIGTKKNLFKGISFNSNEAVFKKVSEKCYLPTNKLILKLLKKYPEFRVSYSITGTFIDQAIKYDKTVLDSFKKLVNTKKVELLNETYYHSLSWLYSKLEFTHQIKLHRSLMWKIFKRRPTIFRNTELIYNDEIANFIRLLGFNGIVAEGWDQHMEWRSPNYVYNASKVETHPEDAKIAEKEKITQRRMPKIKLLTKNYKLSDDIAFRFSNKTWAGYPLTAEKFADWVIDSPGNTVNLFIDYETFGEHQWQDTGILKFLEQLPEEMKKRGITFLTPSETIKIYKTNGDLSVPKLTSWADESRDLSAWTGNAIQDAALNAIYELEGKILVLTKGKNNREEKDILLESWRRMLTSDHFYYMCTKYWSDGDVHKYFSPYDSPYDAYINYMNAFNELILRLEALEEMQRPKKKVKMK